MSITPLALKAYAQAAQSPFSKETTTGNVN